jgi:hypothetical protein
VSWLELLLIPLGFAVGAYGTIIGAGGGFVLVPALLLIYPDDTQEQVTAISLAVVFASAISGSIAHARHRLIDYQTGLSFALFAVPASFAGAYCVRFLPRSAFDVTFGVVLLGVAAYIALGLSRGSQTLREPLRGGRAIVRRRMDRGGGGVSQYAYDARVGLAQTGATGFVAALFGVGGGVMQVPLMATVLRIPLDISVATSQFMVVFMSGAGASLHALAGAFGGDELVRSALLGAGAIAGSQAGAYVSRGLSGRTVTRLLSAGLIAIGLRLVVTPVV